MKDQGEEAVLNLYKACGDFLLGSTVGAVNNTKKLFDISLDAYNGKKGMNNKSRDEVDILNKTK